MAGEIHFDYGITGVTLYALILNGAGNIWNGSAFESPLAANWATYKVALTEQSTTGIYKGTFPVVAAGAHSLSIRLQSGGSPATTDRLIANGYIEWDGTAEILTSSRAEYTAARAAKIDNLDVATSTRSTYAGGAVASVTGNVGGSVASVTADVGITQAGADKVWGSAARALTDKSGFSLAASQLMIKKNVALSNFEFVMYASADHITPKTGLTVTAQRSLDGAAFANCANAVAELSNGVYKIDLAAADLNAIVVTFKFSATDGDTRYLTVLTQT